MSVPGPGADVRYSSRSPPPSSGGGEEVKATAILLALCDGASEDPASEDGRPGGIGSPVSLSACV
jgi:hypothetical protein